LCQAFPCQLPHYLSIPTFTHSRATFFILQHITCPCPKKAATCLLLSPLLVLLLLPLLTHRQA
jgi:hypothetical protein